MAKSCKYYKQQRQVSYDNGVTWIPLDEYQKGALIEVNSSDCTSPSPKIYRWAQTEDTICIFEGKFSARCSDGTTRTIDCNEDSTLTQAETKPSYTAGTCMKSAVIGKCVTTIDDNAFAETSISSVTIGNNVKTIGGGAFWYTSISSITIPNSVEYIGAQAFLGCCLTSVTIPNSVTYLGADAFMNCYYLKDATIGNGVTAINSQAFASCSGLTSVVIGSSVSSIGNNAFYECTSLTSINIPDSVSTIGSSAFYICTGLTSVAIGNGITLIDEEAFKFCTNLQSITINTTTPPTLNNVNTFGNTPIAFGTGYIYVPSASVDVYKSASIWNNFADRIQAIS